MPEKWTIVESAVVSVQGVPCWQVLMLKPDGTHHAHLMPGGTLEWRAAEYGIDPDDVDALLEVVLHEPYMATVDDVEHGPRYADNGPDLWTADNTDEARDAHLARVKACPVRIDVKGEKALDPIRANHRPDPARLSRMREAVDTNRWIKKHGGLPRPPLPQTPVVKKEAARA